VALQVRDLAEARRFYGDTLGCSEGRSAPDWVDFNMYGHQFVCHLNPQLGPPGASARTSIPWTAMACRCRTVGWCSSHRSGANWPHGCGGHAVEWVIEPTTRSKGLPGEQSTLFILDPSGNALEFKSFADLAQLFAR